MSPQQTHLRIVVCVDGSPSSTVAVEWAARDAAMRNVPLRLVHVVPPVVAPPGPWPQTRVSPEFSRWQEDQARQIVEEAHKIAVEAASPIGSPQVDSELVHSPTVPTLIDLSKEAAMIGGLPGPGRGGPRLAGIGQFRPRPPRTLPGRRYPRWGPAHDALPPGAGGGGYRRLADVGVGDRDRLR